MRRVTFFAVCPLLVAMLVSGSTTASAAAPALPKSDFPKKAKITYMPSVSNTDIDSGWSVDQYGNPVFHMISQDDLHRIGGWVEQGVIKSKMIWVIVSSTYAPGTDTSDANHYAAEAMDDFDQTLEVTGWSAAGRNPSLFASGSDGVETNNAIQLAQGLSAYTIAVQMGNAEIEGVAVFISHRNLSSLAWNDLVKQMRDAATLAATPQPQATQSP